MRQPDVAVGVNGNAPDNVGGKARQERLERAARAVRLEVGLEPVCRDENALGERVAGDDLRLRVLAREVADVRAQLGHGDVAHDGRNGWVELEVIEDLLDAVHRLGRHGDERHRGRRERGRLPEPREVEVERERRLAVDRDEGRGCRAVEELGRTLVVEDGLLAVRHLGRG